MADPLVIRCYSDPICPWSWAYDAVLRRIEVQFRSSIWIRPVMGGLALDRQGPADDETAAEIARGWERVARETGQPIDRERAQAVRPYSSRPLCEAVVAASLQSYTEGGAYLRRIREALFLGGPNPYDPQARLDLARATPGLDVNRWTDDLENGAAAEMTDNHFAETRAPSSGAPVPEAGDGGERRYDFPTLVWRDPITETNWFFTGDGTLEAHLAALEAGGLTPEPLLSPAEAFTRYPSLTKKEFLAVTGLEPEAAGEAIGELVSRDEIEVTSVHGHKVYRVKGRPKLH